MKTNRIGRTRVLVAGALAVPVVLGSIALANASTSDDSSGTTHHGTSQLNDEGKQLVEKSGNQSGSISVGPDGVVVDGQKLEPQKNDGSVTGSEFSGSAGLTPEGKKMVEKSGTTSGSITAGPNGITH